MHQAANKQRQPHLAPVPRGAALDQRRPRRDAQPVDMASRVQVVEAIEHDVLTANEVQAKAQLLDVGLYYFYVVL